MSRTKIVAPVLIVLFLVLLVPLPADQMIVFVAPYINWTHPCSTHYISKCDAELKNTPVKIKAVSADGKVLMDKTLRSPTGFFDLWLPRDQAACSDAGECLAVYIQHRAADILVRALDL